MRVPSLPSSTTASSTAASSPASPLGSTHVDGEVLGGAGDGPLGREGSGDVLQRDGRGADEAGEADDGEALGAAKRPAIPRVDVWLRAREGEQQPLGISSNLTPLSLFFSSHLHQPNRLPFHTQHPPSSTSVTAAAWGSGCCRKAAASLAATPAGSSNCRKPDCKLPPCKTLLKPLKDTHLAPLPGCPPAG